MEKTLLSCTEALKEKKFDMSSREIEELATKLKSGDVITDTELTTINTTLLNIKEYTQVLKDKVNNPEKYELTLTQVNDSNINGKIKEINELYTIMDRPDKPIEELVDVFVRLHKLWEQCNDYSKQVKKIEPIYVQ